MEQKLCCVLSAQVVCKECDLSMCYDCAFALKALRFDGLDSGPIYHERFKQCPNGSDHFSIECGVYTFSKVAKRGIEANEPVAL